MNILEKPTEDTKGAEYLFVLQRFALKIFRGPALSEMMKHRAIYLLLLIWPHVYLLSLSLWPEGMLITGKLPIGHRQWFVCGSFCHICPSFSTSTATGLIQALFNFDSDNYNRISIATPLYWSNSFWTFSTLTFNYSPLFRGWHQNKYPEPKTTASLTFLVLFPRNFVNTCFCSNLFSVTSSYLLISILSVFLLDTIITPDTVGNIFLETHFFLIKKYLLHSMNSAF